MPLFTKNPTRMDPYKNFKFVVSWDGAPVLGVSKVSPLTRTTQAVKFRAGGDPGTVRVSPGQTEYAPIKLEQGLTFDPAFELWANKVWYYPNTQAPLPSGQEVSLSDFRKNVTLDFYNEAGQKVMSYLIYRCWVSEFIALPELDSMANAVAIQSITLENEGWQRDYSIQEPAEPSFDTTPPT
jgi:phage tail-like protein